jgi:hypothetical protein
MNNQDKQSKRSKFVGKLLVAAMSGALASSSLVACESSKSTETPAATDKAAEGAAAQPGAAAAQPGAAAAQPAAAATKTEGEAKEGAAACAGKEGAAAKEGAEGCAGKEGAAAKEGVDGCGGANGCGGAAKEGEGEKK